MELYQRNQVSNSMMLVRLDTINSLITIDKNPAP